MNYTPGDLALTVFHGGGVGTPYEMGQMIDNLRKNYQVIVVSTRGHGRSEIGHSELTYEQKANDMLAVMKDVTDEPAILLGFSDGAYTAYKVASMYPERTERIVAIGAGLFQWGNEGSGFRENRCSFYRAAEKNHAGAGTLSGILHELYEILEQNGSRRRFPADD